MEIFPELEHRKTGSQGKYSTLKLETENFRDQMMKLPLEAGNYRILTSNRLPNGNIFAAEYYFEVQIGEMKRVELAFGMQTWKTCWRIFPYRNLLSEKRMGAP